MGTSWSGTTACLNQLWRGPARRCSARMPTQICTSGAALLHSLARNHALVDGNKRLAWTACRTFLAINDQWISAPQDERFDFVIRVATGVEPDLDKIAEQLRTWSYQEG